MREKPRLAMALVCSTKAASTVAEAIKTESGSAEAFYLAGLAAAAGLAFVLGGYWGGLRDRVRRRGEKPAARGANQSPTYRDVT